MVRGGMRLLIGVKNGVFKRLYVLHETEEFCCLRGPGFFPTRSCCGWQVERRARYRRETTMADRVGQHFGQYRLVALLGQGGYAEVYLGQHVRLSLQAAIKVLHTHLSDREAEHFQQEAQTIAKRIHPAIARVF